MNRCQLAVYTAAHVAMMLLCGGAVYFWVL